MTEAFAGIMDKKVIEPESRGERVAAWVEGYLKVSGRSLTELAFRTKADLRDLQRLVRERSVGWRLEDRLAAYFGRIFVDDVFAPVIGDGPSMRELELERERAEIAARAARLQQDREARRGGCASVSADLRVVPDEGRQADV